MSWTPTGIEPMEQERESVTECVFNCYALPFKTVHEALYTCRWLID